LELPDLCVASRVCRMWFCLTSDDSLWKQMYGERIEKDKLLIRITLELPQFRRKTTRKDGKLFWKHNCGIDVWSAKSEFRRALKKGRERFLSGPALKMNHRKLLVFHPMVRETVMNALPDEEEETYEDVDAEDFGGRTYRPRKKHKTAETPRHNPGESMMWDDQANRWVEY
jgi:hypothetical protein